VGRELSLRITLPRVIQSTSENVKGFGSRILSRSRYSRQNIQYHFRIRLYICIHEINIYFNESNEIAQNEMCAFRVTSWIISVSWFNRSLALALLRGHLVQRIIDFPSVCIRERTDDRRIISDWSDTLCSRAEHRTDFVSSIHVEEDIHFFRISFAITFEKSEYLLNI